MSTSDLDSLPQGDLRLLEHPVAQQLLASDLPVRFAYTAMDGTPRVIPTWFHWTGEEVVMPTFISAPHIPRPARRLPALRANPSVALTIDTAETPPDVLLMRGCVEITEVDGIVAEYAASARQYMGEEPASGYLAMADQPGTRQARISLRPHWVGLLDFETRLPGG